MHLKFGYTILYIKINLYPEIDAQKSRTKYITLINIHITCYKVQASGIAQRE